MDALVFPSRNRVLPLVVQVGHPSLALRPFDPPLVGGVAPRLGCGEIVLLVAASSLALNESVEVLYVFPVVFRVDGIPVPIVGLRAEE